MKKEFWLTCISACLLAACCEKESLPVTPTSSDLQFGHLAKTWDEGIPLGNATVGTLVWQRDSVLRFSLDRTDLWDLRPMDSIAGPNNRFAWVCEQVRKGDYLPVQKKFDHPYNALPAPSKIPGAALEFPLNIGKVSSVHLFLNNALCEVLWENGTKLKTFVHADEPVGWFVFENLPDTVSPEIIAPRYSNPDEVAGDNSHAGPALGRLGYKQGTIQKEAGTTTFHQEGWGGFSYDVVVRWQQKGGTLSGVWSLTSSLAADRADQETAEAMERGVEADYRSHMDFWKGYWAQSSVSLPDTLLQKQYDNEMYKFGSAAREDSYPISLQAVWTADNGMLPPWKGDYHHDLNTQLSYWPAYTGNHLQEGMGYLNTLWEQRDVYKKIYPRVFRDGRDECSRRLHPDRRADGRMGTVLHVADGQRMAGTAFLSALEVFGRPHFPERAGLPVSEGRGDLSRTDLHSRCRRSTPVAAEFQPGNFRQLDQCVVQGYDKL